MKLSEDFSFYNTDTWSFRDYAIMYIYVKSYDGTNTLSDDTNITVDSLKLEGLVGDIVVAKCSDSENEALYVATTIKKLLKSGRYRCRDIAVIERTNGTYKKSVIDALKKLSV